MNATRRVCRICFDEETDEKPVINPCLCKGTSKYIHEECLSLWLATQSHIKNKKACEVCKYNYKVEVKLKRKCNPREGISANPHFICYLGILLLVGMILSILIYVVISKDYINPQSSITYFLGILSIFVFSLLCTFGIIIKLLRQLCWIDSSSSYKIYPIKHEEDQLNTTNMVQSLPRVESLSHSEPNSFAHYVVEGDQVFIENK